MSEAVTVALITGALALLGNILSVWASSRKQAEEFKIEQAKMTTKIEELTREVREHNGFAQRMPVVEEQIKSINHRLKNLEEDDRK